MEVVAEQLTLPTSYGAPDRVLGWDEVERKLVESTTYWLTTTRRDGRPHAVPVDGIWWEGALYFGGDPATVHVRNLRSDPRVVVHTESGASPVIAEGTAEWHQPSREEISGLAAATQAKYGYPVSPDSYRAGIWRLSPTRAGLERALPGRHPVPVRLMGGVPPVARLVTYVDLTNDVVDDRRLSVSARHEAVLADGRRALLLDDRGWSESGPPDIWATASVEDVEFTARTVVGPDEPFGGRTFDDMATDHWVQLAGNLRQQGIVIDPAELRQLSHDVVLSERLRGRLGVGRDR